MKYLFMQNCFSKEEYFKFIKIDLKYFDELEVNIIETLVLSEDKFNYLINNLRIENKIFLKYKQQAYIDRGIANVLEIKSQKSDLKMLISLNGHIYARYVAFI